MDNADNDDDVPFPEPKDFGVPYALQFIRDGQPFQGHNMTQVWRCAVKTPQGEREQVALKRICNDEVDRCAARETDIQQSIEGVASCRDWSVDREDQLTEIGVLHYLSSLPSTCSYLQRLIPPCVRTDRYTYLPTQFGEGGDVLEVMWTGKVPRGWPRVVMWQLLKAVAYLHQHNVGHRDISVENLVFVRKVDMSTRLDQLHIHLIDFGQARVARSSDGRELRYSMGVGKPYSMAPEMYVPSPDHPWRPFKYVRNEATTREVVSLKQYAEAWFFEVLVPAGPAGPCEAEPAGYRLGPADVFACGVTLFYMDAVTTPWRTTAPTDPSFKHFMKDVPTLKFRGVLRKFTEEKFLPHVSESYRRRQAVDLALPPGEGPAGAGEKETAAGDVGGGFEMLCRLMHIDPAQRITAAQALEDDWLRDLNPQAAAASQAAAAATQRPGSGRLRSASESRTGAAAAASSGSRR